MAQTGKDWEKYDRERMVLAMQEIRKSPNLRHFVRHIMADLNPLSPQGGTAEQIAMQAGAHNAGVNFLGTLDAFDATLWLELQIEGITEFEARDKGDGHEPSDA